MSTQPIPRHLAIVEESTTTTVYRSVETVDLRALYRFIAKLQWENAMLKAELELTRSNAEKLLNGPYVPHHPSDEAVASLAPHRRGDDVR